MGRRLFDSYTLYARILPAVVSALPFLILWYFLTLQENLRNLLDFLTSIQLYGSLTLSLIFLYFYAQLIRQASKFFERRYFLDRNGFPTTYLMSYSNDVFSKAYKDAYRSRVVNDFSLQLMNEERERQNPEEAKRLLNDAIRQIIPRCRDRGLVKQQNILYGMWRNLIGGSVFSILLCLCNIAVGYLVFPSQELIVVSVVLLILYVALLALSKPFLVSSAEDYARQLLAEYMDMAM